MTLKSCEEEVVDVSDDNTSAMIYYVEELLRPALTCVSSHLAGATDVLALGQRDF